MVRLAESNTGWSHRTSRDHAGTEIAVMVLESSMSCCGIKDTNCVKAQATESTSQEEVYTGATVANRSWQSPTAL